MLFQAYETSFRSWTAVHYDATRTRDLERYFSALPLSQEIFIYQAPEVVPFAEKHKSYQYTELTASLGVGKDYASLVASGTAQMVITPAQFFDGHAKDVFSHYVVTGEVDSYVILAPK